MPRGWQWDETLFAGSAPYYERGRLPYPPGLADALAACMQLDGRGRLIDVGCGPGIIAFHLAHLFEEVVGLDADREMIAEAKRRAAELGVTNARWVCALAEGLPAGLGAFRVATFAQSFHWMDRDLVAAAIREMLEPCGAFVQVSRDVRGFTDTAAASEPLRYPSPPEEAIEALVRSYLGSERRAGQGVLRYGTPSGEAEVLAGAGFEEPELVYVPGREVVIRTIDDLVARQFSISGSAPHLFGNRKAEFEADLRAILAASSLSGLYAQRTDDAELRVWRKPAR
jgi:SAM-dependent methyltransferase